MFCGLMSFARSELPRVRALAPVLAAAVFTGGCLLAVSVLTSRPASWRTVDLEVYRAGARALLHGRDLYGVHVGHLPFTYPPFAALSFAPVALLGPVGARVAMTAASTLALVVCLGLAVRAARPTWTARVRWTAALLASTAALLADPVYWTLSFGQVNLLLMALVLVDLLADRAVLPRGVLVGLATAVKLTPGIVIVYLAATRRIRCALAAAVTVAASAGVGFLVAPGPSREYWGNLVFQPRRVGGLEFTGNQSLRGVVARLAGAAGSGVGWWMLVGGATALVGLSLAVHGYRAHGELLGVSLCAVTGLLVSPVSWNHHWVWAVPVAVVLWARFLDLRVPGRLAAALAWTGLFGVAPIWWVPARDGREFAEHGFQLVTGNAYVVAGLVLLAGTPLLAKTTPRSVPWPAPDPPPHPDAPPPAGPPRSHRPAHEAPRG